MVFVMMLLLIEASISCAARTTSPTIIISRVSCILEAVKKRKYSLILSSRAFCSVGEIFSYIKIWKLCDLKSKLLPKILEINGGIGGRNFSTSDVSLSRAEQHYRKSPMGLFRMLKRKTTPPLGPFERYSAFIVLDKGILAQFTTYGEC